MKAFRIIIFALLAALSVSAYAQQNESSASVVRRAREDAKKANAKKNGNISDRMQSFYEAKEKSDADLEWMRVIYRSLEIKEDANTCLFYPEEPNQDGQSLFYIIMRLLIDGKINAYEYLDGREMFTDQYKVKVKDILDRYGIIYTNAMGSTEKNPRYAVEDSDIPGIEVLNYYIIERYEFDRVSTRVKRRVEAICPVLHRASEWGGEAVRYPMFWVKLNDIRPNLAQQYVFTDNDNNLPRYNYDDYFLRNMYKGDIYKTKNLRNKTLMQLYPDPDDLKHAQDSIEARLNSFDANLWVPSREELQARAEAAEAAAENDSTVVIKNRDNKKKESSSTKRSTKRGQKNTKVKESKQKTTKVKSATVRSVRNRKK